MRSLILACALVAVASSTILDTTSRVKSHLDIGTNTFLLVASSPNSNCAGNVTHGRVDVPPLTDKFEGYGIEGSMQFSEINVNGEECTGGQNATGNMAILSLDELKRFRSSGVLNLNKTAAVKVFLSAIDTQARVCGNYNSGGRTYYLYTKEIAAYDKVLTDFSITAPPANVQSGEKWMLAYQPEPSNVCIYIDSTSPSLITAGNFTDATPTPMALDPSTTPETVAAPPINDDAGPEATVVPTETTSGRVCFPSSATVQLVDGTIKTMDNVELGDKVMTSNGVYSDVFMFTHKLANVKHSFVVLKTNSGSEIALTAGHMLYVNGALASAGTVKVGDSLESASGNLVEVVSISSKIMTGLYNPQTAAGDVVVNGIRASTYTTAVNPKAAHALLAPLRGLFARLGLATAAFEETSNFIPMAVTSVLS